MRPARPRNQSDPGPRMRLLALGLALGLASDLAAADVADPQEIATLEACAAAHLPSLPQAEKACLGRLATPCMEIPENHTTIGMIDCLHTEHAAWDALLNADWPLLKAQAEEMDAANAVPGLELTSAAQALLAAQRAWLAWREAECTHLAAEWGAGTHGRVVLADCYMTLTGRRALQFRARLADWPQ